MHKGMIAVLLASILVLPGCIASDDGVELYGVEYREPPDAPDFTLFDQNGDQFTLSEHEGKVVVVAFVYTSCPDVCLVISANLDYIGQNLADYSDDVVIVSVTIDPARDTVSHLAEWTEQMGYEWPHLTGQTVALQDTYRSWNVIVDNEHIAASEPPSESLVRVAVLNPDNSSMVVDSPCQGPTLAECFQSGSELMDYAMSSANISYEPAHGLIGEWQEDGNWTWILHIWDSSTERWVDSGTDEPDVFDINSETHLAWIASGANLSMAPSGEDCNGHGWIMGSGGGAHCMCDEGYERPDGDWLSCVAEGTGSSGQSNGTDPHDESLGEYEVGHSTVTFILDKQLRKRVAYSGINWEVDEFLYDLKALADE